MKLFKNIRKRQDIALIAEEKLYEYVAEEMAAGKIRQGLWTRATVETDSNTEENINKKYIALRVEYLRAEGRLYKQFLEEALAAAEAMPQADDSESTKISEPTEETVRQEIEVDSIYSELWERAKMESPDSDSTAIRNRYIELHLQFLKSRFNCPFCHNIMNDYGKCPNCGCTVDQCVLDAQKNS